MENLNNIPILLGRVFEHEKNWTISSALGLSYYLDDTEYEVINKMQGYLAFTQIASELNIGKEQVKEVYNKLSKMNMVTTLDKWNVIRWCDNCKGYVITEEKACPNCGEPLSYILLTPPCDIWILLNEEHSFVRTVLKEKKGLILSQDSLLFGNWCFKGQVPMWEIIYQGKIILTIYFNGTERKSWTYEFAEGLEDMKPVREERTFKENIEYLIKINEGRLKSIELQTEAIIQDTYKLYPSEPLIYFSGGKESMVMAAIFSKLSIPCNLLSVFPGLDQPDDISFFNNEVVPFVKKFDFFKHYIYEQDSTKFYELVGERGKLSGIDPWCRTAIKMPLKHRATMEIYNGNYFVAYEGSRKYETNYRRRYSVVNFPENYPNQLWVHPIAYWTGLDLWLYIFKNNLPISPVYYKGFQKTTCWCCPLVQPFHMECSRKYYPELWDKIEDLKLIGFEESNNNMPY